MSKKRGNLLIENIISIAIIMIVISSICEIIICRANWQAIKNKKDELLRISYCIEQEMKYNLSIEEIKELANNNVICLSDDDILKQLTTDSLLNINRGNDILISIEDLSSERIKVHICLNEECYGNTIESERDFIKDSVMNEYYK